jgi:hypothetical protein
MWSVRKSCILWVIQYLQEEIVFGGGNCDCLYSGVLAHGAKRQSAALCGRPETCSGEWYEFVEGHMILIVQWIYGYYYSQQSAYWKHE